MKKLLFVSLPILLLLSCNDTRYDAELGQLDALIASVDSAQTLHTRIDTTGYDSLTQGYSLKMSFVQQSITQKLDTMPRELALFMSQYKNMRKPYGQFKSKYASNGKELEFSKKQLTSLRHDLEKNLLDTTIVNTMMDAESRATQNVVEETKRLAISAGDIKERAAYLEPKIDSIIRDLKARS